MTGTNERTRSDRDVADWPISEVDLTRPDMDASLASTARSAFLTLLTKTSSLMERGKLRMTRPTDPESLDPVPMLSETGLTITWTSEMLHELTNSEDVTRLRPGLEQVVLVQ